jgi:ketosteroid isomerase-like protein
LTRATYPGANGVAVPDNPITDENLSELIEIVGRSASAFIRGDMETYLALIRHSDDYTLMPPTGGDVVRGFDASEGRLAEMSSFFKRGEASVEIAETYASGDLAVIVIVERQHGEVGDYPAQDWSLRVTLVFRREGAEWKLAHRHADALVHPITFDQLAELARG